ncbi:MAG: DUF2061 domain-containing protein [bacterium]
MNRKASIIKSITLRIIATLTTMLLVYIFSGEIVLAGYVGLVEVFTKLILHYIYDRAWFRVFRVHARQGSMGKIEIIIKTVGWRIIGTLDTLFIVYIFSREISLAGSVALTEIIAKMLIYYVHERIWIIITSRKQEE